MLTKHTLLKSMATIVNQLVCSNKLCNSVHHPAHRWPPFSPDVGL